MNLIDATGPEALLRHGAAAWADGAQAAQAAKAPLGTPRGGRTASPARRRGVQDAPPAVVLQVGAAHVQPLPQRIRFVVAHVLGLARAPLAHLALGDVAPRALRRQRQQRPFPAPVGGALRDHRGGGGTVALRVGAAAAAAAAAAPPAPQAQRHRHGREQQRADDREAADQRHDVRREFVLRLGVCDRIHDCGAVDAADAAAVVAAAAGKAGEAGKASR